MTTDTQNAESTTKAQSATEKKAAAAAATEQAAAETAAAEKPYAPTPSQIARETVTTGSGATQVLIHLPDGGATAYVSPQALPSHFARGFRLGAPTVEADGATE